MAPSLRSRWVLWAVLGAVGALFVPRDEAGIEAGVRENGYVVVDGAISSAASAKAHAAVHARLALGECPTVYEDATRSGWMRKDCPLPVDLNATSAILRQVSTRFKGAIEAAAGEDPHVCEFASMFSFPGATHQRPHQDLYASQGGGVTVVVYLDGVEEATAPLEVWPQTHNTTKLKGVPKKLAPLRAGTAVIYDSTLYHRGTANTNNKVRTSVYVSYCKDASERAATYLPELFELDGAARFRLSDVIAGRADAISKSGERYDETERDAYCKHCLQRFDETYDYPEVPDIQKHDGSAPGDGFHSTLDESALTRHPPETWPDKSACLPAAGCRPNAYARGTSNLFKHAAKSKKHDIDYDEDDEDPCSFCDVNLAQALAEVGVWRRDSVLWSITDRKAALGAAQFVGGGDLSVRKDLVGLARNVVDGAVRYESAAIDEAARAPKLPEMLVIGVHGQGDSETAFFKVKPTTPMEKAFRAYEEKKKLEPYQTRYFLPGADECEDEFEISGHNTMATLELGDGTIFEARPYSD